jgi:hypothetical protein
MEPDGHGAPMIALYLVSIVVAREAGMRPVHTDWPYTGVTGFGSGSFDRIQLKPRTTTRFSRASSNSE